MQLAARVTRGEETHQWRERTRCNEAHLVGVVAIGEDPHRTCRLSLHLLCQCTLYAMIVVVVCIAIAMGAAAARGTQQHYERGKSSELCNRRLIVHEATACLCDGHCGHRLHVGVILRCEQPYQRREPSEPCDRLLIIGVVTG